MAHTVTGLADRPLEAQRIIDDLTSLCLCDRADISLIARDQAAPGSTAVSEAVRAAGQLTAAAASTFGALLGAGSRAVSRNVNVSGFGVLSVAGRLGGVLSKATLAGAEDLANAFKEFGMEGRFAREHADALQRGSILVVVEAKTAKAAECARQVMATHGAVAVD